MTSLTPSKDALLDAFLVAFRNDPGVLASWCLDHPEASRDFIALAHELALQRALASDGPIDAAAEHWIAAAVPSHPQTASDPFAGLTPQSMKTLRQALGVPSVVINAFMDRLVAASSVPLAFMERMAEALGAELEPLATYLGKPPRLAHGVRYKADGAPVPPDGKMSFGELLAEAGVDPQRQTELLDEDD